MILQKLLLFSHSGFSDSNANGITMKNLLSAWEPEEKAQVYCDVQAPDFSAAHRHFRVTDTQMVKAFFGKKGQCVFTYDPKAGNGEKRFANSEKNARRIPGWLKKYKYNFCLKWLREILRQVSPWGHRQLHRWIREFDPDVLVYMVGESICMDKLVLKVWRQTQKPLVLYNGEAFRIIDLKTRRGLERAYYRKTQKLYARLNDAASLVIYNCDMLKEDYEALYPPRAKAIVAYNSALCDQEPYRSGDGVTVTYFGNLGVGRSPVLRRAAEILSSIDEKLVLDIYGSADSEAQALFESCPNIRYHGFVDARTLRGVIGRSDILLHVESFEPGIVPKLRYAFSTKIAQCLCAGRCFVSYAPAQTASTRYLRSVEGVVVASGEEQLRQVLTQLATDPALRQAYAKKALETGMKNHNMHTTAQWVREEIGAIAHETVHL